MATKLNPTYTLSGRIVDRQGKPLAGLTVRAYDQDLRSKDDLLGEATTNRDGRYTIRFAQVQFKHDDKESSGPDLYIRVFDEDEQVAISPVRRNAGRRTSISLQVDLPAGAA
ncbi:MAG: carboxypeptidase regulatory-like domain-containing protein [Caldilineales bacterium]|nr:carboxypeptidase regulatory-like domain-containing protein [Caldilineales bacterium]